MNTKLNDKKSISYKLEPQLKAKVAILISDKIDFEIKIIRNKESLDNDRRIIRSTRHF